MHKHWRDYFDSAVIKFLFKQDCGRIEEICMKHQKRNTIECIRGHDRSVLSASRSYFCPFQSRSKILYLFLVHLKSPVSFKIILRCIAANKSRLQLYIYVKIRLISYHTYMCISAVISYHSAIIKNFNMTDKCE